MKRRSRERTTRWHHLRLTRCAANSGTGREHPVKCRPGTTSPRCIPCKSCRRFATDRVWSQHRNSRESPYAQDDDWFFPSFKNKGRTPRSGSSLVTDHIKAAAIRAGVIKEGDKRPSGLHVLRHSLATILISWGLDIKTVQTLLRHSNVTTTLDIYSQGVDKHRLAAQGLMMDAVMNPASEMLQ